MNKYIVTLVMALMAFTVNAQTNTNSVEGSSVSLTNAPSVDKEYGKWELTLGGAGVVIPKTGESSFGVSVSLANDPLKKLPNLWFGINQELAWEPTFAGSTDLYSEWAWNVYKDLWVNTGWSAGVLYDKETNPIFRTGPQIEAEYYIGSNSFLFTSLNYDLQSRGNGGFRYSFGIGVTW